MRCVLILCLFLLGGGGAAQAQDPQVKVDIPQDTVPVGQPYLIRVEVLVPTFMPDPPVFPSFEAPGLLVRLPERATSPISAQIGGDTWSGVRRTIRVYPMQAGATTLPPQEIALTYKDPDSNQDVSFSAPVPAIEIMASVPPGAADLDPLILAQNLDIQQDWQVAEGPLAVGDAVVRTLEITVAGTSALFVPPLLEAASPQAQNRTAEEGMTGFLAYPEDAVVSESMDRGVLSGTRRETTSYIAQAGGSVVFPDIVLQWYNIDTDQIEEITMPGREITVSAPPARRALPDLETLLRAWPLLLLVALVTAAGVRWGLPFVRRQWDRLRIWYAGTAHAAYRAAQLAARAQDLNALFAALDLMAARGVPAGPNVQRVVEDVTQARFGPGGENSAPHEALWQRLRAALGHHRPPLWRGNRQVQADLPKLNPF